MLLPVDQEKDVLSHNQLNTVQPLPWVLHQLSEISAKTWEKGHEISHKKKSLTSHSLLQLVKHHRRTVGATHMLYPGSTVPHGTGLQLSKGDNGLASPTCSWPCSWTHLTVRGHCKNISTADFQTFKVHFLKDFKKEIAHRPSGQIGKWLGQPVVSEHGIGLIGATCSVRSLL